MLKMFDIYFGNGAISNIIAIDYKTAKNFADSNAAIRNTTVEKVEYVGERMYIPFD